MDPGQEIISELYSGISGLAWLPKFLSQPLLCHDPPSGRFWHREGVRGELAPGPPLIPGIQSRLFSFRPVKPAALSAQDCLQLRHASQASEGWQEGSSQGRPLEGEGQAQEER